MKIENYETWKSDISADTFTFPYNPKSFEDSIQGKLKQNNSAYEFDRFSLPSPIKKSRAIVLSGHFSGTSKNSDYQTLAKHMNDKKVKKVYFSDNKFMIVFPKTIKRTHQGGRTNFIDYNAGFISPFGILFDDTQKSGDDTSSNTNQGNSITPIEKITGDVSSGNTVTIQDPYGNGIEFTASTTGTFTLRLINFRDLGLISFTEFYYGEIGGTEQNIQIANNDKDMFMILKPSDSLSGFSATNISNLQIFFRDGYTSD